MATPADISDWGNEIEGGLSFLDKVYVFGGDADPTVYFAGVFIPDDGIWYYRSNGMAYKRENGAWKDFGESGLIGCIPYIDANTDLNNFDLVAGKIPYLDESGSYFGVDLSCG